MKLAAFEALTLTGGGPKLGNGLTGTAEVSAKEWWDQIVFVSYPYHLTRGQMVLFAANKDGGAHVDPKLPPGYEKAIEGLWTEATSIGGVETTRHIRNSNLAALRQMAYELLNSPDLLRLAN